MTQPANATTVLAPWDEVYLERDGRRTRLYRDGDAFMVDVPAMGSTGVRADERWQVPVVMTTGSHHLQLYWMALPWTFTDQSAGAALFKARCESCHSEDKVSLDGRRLSRSLLQSHLLSDDHVDDTHLMAQSGLGAQDRVALLAYVQALQHTDRLAQLPFAWFVREQRWIHEEDSFLQPPVEVTEDQPYTEGWSSGCDRCHSVEPSSSWDSENAVADASVVELGIACEACHGPGRAHASRHQGPLSRYAAHLGLTDVDDIIQPTELSPDRANGVCGQCHAELEPLTDGPLPDHYTPGDDLNAVAHVWQWADEDHAADLPPGARDALDAEPDVLRNAFWRDGTVRIAGRDLNGLDASPCTTKGGMTCMSCHQMHGADPNDQLKPSATGDSPAGEQVCVDCHTDKATEDHTHHPTASTGARCLNCHMPHTTIGLLTVMRAHRVDAPTATSSADSGRPLACNLCHLDKSLAWSAEHMGEWYDQDSAIPPQKAPQSIDQGLRGDAAQRAVWAWHLGWPAALEASGADWPAGLLVELVDDPYVAVRTIARSRLRQDPRFADLDWDPAATPAALAPMQARLRTRWTQSMDGRTDPALWLKSGAMDAEKVDYWKLLRDERDVIVNE